MPSPLGKGKGKASASVTPFAPAAPLVPPTSARTTKKPKPGKAAADKYRVADDTLTDLKEEAKQTVSPLPTGGGRRKSTMEQNFADASMIYSRRGGLSSRANRRSSTFNINIGATGVMGPPTVARRRTKTARRPAVHSGAGGTAGALGVTSRRGLPCVCCRVAATRPRCERATPLRVQYTLGLSRECESDWRCVMGVRPRTSTCAECAAFVRDCCVLRGPVVVV